jgi:plastocyanin
MALAIALAACGSSSSRSSNSNSTAAEATSSTTAATPDKTPLHGKVKVSISNYSYHSATITAAPGTKVTFTNHDPTSHTATSTKTAFDTGTVKPRRSATILLTKLGTYTYYCQFHAFMHGTIVVN